MEWAAVSLVYFLAGILGLRELGVPLTSLVAPATVAGVAIGFGAQQVVGDVLAGFFLFAERQFGVGDQIRLSTPGQLTGVSGTVEELTLRVTKVRSAQGELIVVPNSALRQVTNLSKDWSRVVIDIPIPAEEDLDHVISIIGKAASGMAALDDWRDQIIGEPVVAGVENIEVGYVLLRLLVRTLPGRQFDVGRELRLRVVMALRAAEHLDPGGGRVAIEFFMRISDGLAALRRPISDRVRVRWSTAVMVILFLGLGALYLEVKTTTSSTAAASKTINDVTKGLQPGDSIVISRPGTTTTTTVARVPSRPSGTTTTTSPATTTAPVPSTTELGHNSTTFELGARDRGGNHHDGPRAGLDVHVVHVAPLR